LFVDQSIQSIAGANLCTSSCDKDEVSIAEMEQLIEVLIKGGIKGPNPFQV